MNNFPILDSPRVILHVIIPGEPCAQERHRWGQNNNYDPMASEKKTFLWQLKAAFPILKPTDQAVCLRLIFRTCNLKTDADNLAKFYMDAMTPKKTTKKEKSKFALKGVAPSPAFAPWHDDRQVEELYVRIHRGATDPRTEILVYKL